MSEQLSLFGPPESSSRGPVKSKKALDRPPGAFVPQSHAQTCRKFHDYDGFIKKFEPKKTTDDCYTPPAVYAAVLDWLRTRVDLRGRPILRPFFPGVAASSLARCRTRSRPRRRPRSRRLCPSSASRQKL